MQTHNHGVGGGGYLAMLAQIWYVHILFKVFDATFPIEYQGNPCWIWSCVKANLVWITPHPSKIITPLCPGLGAPAGSTPSRMEWGFRMEIWFYLNTQLFCEINRNDEEWFFCSKLYLRSMGPLPKSSKSSSWHHLISFFLPEGRAGLRLPALLLASHGGQVWMRITQWDPFMQLDPPWDCCSPHLLKPMAMHGHHNSCWSHKGKAVAWSASMHNVRLSATTAAGGTDFVSHPNHFRRWPTNKILSPDFLDAPTGMENLTQKI